MTIYSLRAAPITTTSLGPSEGTQRVRKFVGDWFRSLDDIDHETRGRRFLPSLAKGELNIQFPGFRTIKTRKDFLEWYAGIADNFKTNHHTVGPLNVQPRRDGGYDVDLTVKWDAVDKKGAATSARFRQHWTVVMEDGAPKVRDYLVRPLPGPMTT